MQRNRFAITGIGVVAPNGIGKKDFWSALEEGKSAIGDIASFETDKIPVHNAGEIRNMDPVIFLGGKELRNPDRNSLLLLAATKLALDDGKIKMPPMNGDDIGICTGTTFSHLSSIMEFDREVFREGLDFANPAFFPLSVMNAASSQVSIRFGIKGFNTTVSTGYTSSLTALKYSLDALENRNAKIVLSGGFDVLTPSVFWGFYKLGCLAGLKGIPLCCPFDKRRNGIVLGEAAVMFALEEIQSARERNANIFSKIKSVVTYSNPVHIGRSGLKGKGLETAIRAAIDEADVELKDIDYISSCSNSSRDFDEIEVNALKKVFGNHLINIPVSSIKSMVGETISASAALQIVSCVGAITRGVLPPTINYEEKDHLCDIDCIPNKAREKDVKVALITSMGPGGYSGACVLERYQK
jgi:3-oxoacyl-[acyl-carrier-protein] synthase II